jgi:hypothetical protein
MFQPYRGDLQECILRQAAVAAIRGNVVALYVDKHIFES